MKSQWLTQVLQYKTHALLALAAAASVLTITSCGNSGGGSNHQNNYLGASCIACPPGTGAYLTGAIGQSVSQNREYGSYSRPGFAPGHSGAATIDAELALSFFGQSQGGQYPGQFPGQFPGGFQGAGFNPGFNQIGFGQTIAAQGVLVVRPYNRCQIPAGSYNLQTLRPGIFQGGIVQQLSLITNAGAVGIEVVLNGAHINPAIPGAPNTGALTGTTAQSRLSGRVYIRSASAFGGPGCSLFLQ